MTNGYFKIQFLIKMVSITLLNWNADLIFIILMYLTCIVSCLKRITKITYMDNIP